MSRPRKYNPAPGDRYGRLVVIFAPDPEPGKERRVRVRCDCGNEVSPLLKNVCRGLTRSCGCLLREVAAKAAAEMATGRPWWERRRVSGR